MTSSPAAVPVAHGRSHGPGTGTVPTPGGGLSHRQIVTILTGLMLGMFLAALDQTIVASAIRTIGDDLKGLSVQAWVTTAYLITSTISTPLYGKLSDIFGRRPLFLTAISIFVVGSAACAFSTSMYMLAAFRAFQGLGAGGLFSLALAIIGDIVPPRERARYQGYFLAVFGTSSVLGPVIGGFFAGTDQILGITGWRWVFLVNVPIGILALVVVSRTLHIPHRRLDHRIDYLGAVLLVVCLVPLLTVLEQGRDWGWTSPRSIAFFTVAAIGLLLFVWAEHRCGEEALIPLRFFRNRTFSVVSAVGVVTGVGMFGGLAVLPLYLQIVRGATPTQSGLMLLPLTGGIMVGSIFSGQLISRTGRYKVFPIVGILLMIIGMWLLHTVGAETPFWRTEVFTAIFGLGLGNVMQPITLAVQNAMSPRDIGVATSSVTFFRQMGATVGTAIFLSILFSTVGDNIRNAFVEAAKTPAFLGALRDPAVRANPSNAPILGMLSQHASVSSSAINDTSFLKFADRRLAEPFFVGFSESMQLVFLVGALVLVVGFVLIFFMPEIPLRTQSGIDALRSDAVPEAAAVPRAAAVPEVTAVSEVTTGEPVADQPPPTPAAVPAPDHQVAVVGRVSGPDAAPVRGARLTLTDLEGRQVGQTRTQEDGRYRLLTAGEGTLLLICTAETFQPGASMVVVTGTDVRCDLTVTAAARIGGRIVRADDQHPLAGASVTLTDARGHVVGVALSAPDGHYLIDDVVAGQYTVTAGLLGHRSQARGVSVGDGARIDLDLELPVTGELAGVVRVARTGQGHPEASVSLVDAQGNLVRAVVSGPDGAYRLDDVPPGTYTLIASGYSPVAQRVDVHGRGRDHLDVVLGLPRDGADGHDGVRPGSFGEPAAP